MRLEKYAERDKALYEQLVFNESVMSMNLGRVFTREEAAMAFRMVLEQNASEPLLGTYKVFIGEGDREAYIGMGAVCRNEEYDAVEIEYMLLPQYWDQGHGTALVGLLFQMAADSRLGTKALAITDPENVRSRKVLLKNGFQWMKQELNEAGEPIQIYRKNFCA